MIRRKHKIIYWLPRVLSVLLSFLVFTLAFGCFVDEAPDQQAWTLKQKFICFFWQLLPAGILAAVTAVAWRLELYGGFLFFLMGLAYLVFYLKDFDLTTFLALPGLAMFIGLLFWLNKYLRRDENDIIVC